MGNAPPRPPFPLWLRWPGWVLLALCVLRPLPVFAQDDPPPAPAVDGPAGETAGVFSPRAPRLLPRRSLSTSKQFIVFAESGTLRAAVGRVGEEAREGLRRLLGPETTDPWRVPIVVDLRRPPAGLPGALPPSRLTLGQTGLGLKIQLELLLGEAGRDVRVREELVRALLLEIAYRETADLPAGRAFCLPPPWLVEGCTAFLEVRADDTGFVLDKLTTVLAAPRAALPLAAFLVQDPTDMDSTSRAIYRAYAYGLLRVLSEETPGGRVALLGFLRGLPGTAPGQDLGPGPLLARLRPDVARTPATLDKWWSAARARLAASQRAVAILSAEETERELAKLLNVTVPGKPPDTAAAAHPVAGRVYPLEDFDKYLVSKETLKSSRAARAENTRRLAPVRGGLLALLSRAHPFYRPIVAGYEAATVQLGRGDTWQAAPWLHALAAERAQALTREEAISDYLNWFEATQPSTPSGAFDAYFRAARQIEAEMRRPPRRTDPISVYLDAVEAEF